MDHETKACVKLWLAVFLDGCKQYAKEFKVYTKAKEKNDWTSTVGYPSIRWVDAGGNDVGSFNWLCEVFDLDPDRARTSIRKNVRKLAKED